ncbi:acetyl-coenzyme A synthetase, chloroplastic/glyoxysomal-like [Dorcoceras hygrometricum]|uniref:Acetyl-coenzyme A synthetase, chloroplastic/glyoxysomal-like n=1 Tax=Dorcoceras hygrometricum TaxID=472368 RepID=A0A2Z7DET6_9LAMI|nr:acetyl-coenzyme A synthetase, chloroplastic/glyoxysomal-like [Dorcoceras hygrometricum]
MASSLFSNTVHVCFDSVLAMDNPGMVLMFESIMESGLKGFLGCLAVLYEAALVEFFENASVRDGDSKEFPASKILTDKTVHRYIVVNDKLEVEDVSRVKKTPVKRAVSRKRPAAVDKPVVKKKRTCVGKVSAVTASPALEAVPIQTVAPISTMPPSAPKRKIQKSKRRLALGSDDEIVQEPIAVAVVAIENPVPADADVVDEGISTADDVDNH